MQDDTNQTDNTQAADAAVNPALPPADIASTLGAPATPEVSFPAVPTADPSTAPTTTDTTSSTDDATASDNTLGSAYVAPDPIAASDTTDDTPATPTPEPEAAAPAELLSTDDTAATADDTTTEEDSSPFLNTSDDEPVDDTAATDDSSDASDTSEVEGLGEDAEELLDIKKQALEDLNPLVDKLEQSPEERFRTTMMMIQASDNQTLVKQAFEAAQGIEDDKARAQALLDVINEINYFTTQAKKQ